MTVDGKYRSGICASRSPDAVQQRD